ncbi:MAG: hypothetical protein M1840_000146 [Geoglossum simile]|nr:MAG: hypothetical protein M1840_000146 [Geoglossum simile]
MASTQPPQVLRIPRSDANSDSFILLHVLPVGSSSSAPLDLDLTATEGENPYTGSVRQKTLAKLRAKNYAGDDGEWAAILSVILLRQKPEGSGVEAMKGLVVVASLNGDNLMVTFRKDIGGIMQRLGTISMQLNDDAEIELFQWAGIAARLATAVEDELTSLRLRYRSQEETIKKLDKQLEDFIRAKVEHDNELLEKFVELLNAKKLKIRDQQRLLDAAKMGSSTVIHTQPAGGPAATAPRSRKRKAATPESSGDDGAGIEKEDANEETPGEVESASTPEKTDEDETEDDEDDAQFQSRPPAPQPRARRGARGSKGSGHEAVTRKGKVSSPPPPRQLPFAKREASSGGGRARRETNDGGDDETGESDDDEL